VRVAVGALNLNHAFAHFENRDIEGAAAEIVDGDAFVLLLVQPVSQRRRRRLIDDAFYFQAGDPSGMKSSEAGCQEGTSRELVEGPAPPATRVRPGPALRRRPRSIGLVRKVLPCMSSMLRDAPKGNPRRG